MKYALLLLAPALLFAQGPKSDLLWLEGAPGAVGQEAVDEPSIDWYRPATPNGAAVLVCPGGGYGGRALDRLFGTAEALPSNSRELDLAAAPRRALLVTLQIAILLVAGGPLVVIVQPFYPAVPGAAVLMIFVLALVYPLWRSATHLQGHVQAGAQVVLEALISQNDESTASAEEQARALVPGLGDTCLVKVESDWSAVDRSLKQIGLRGRSGATVVAIQRGSQEIIYPSANELLRAGDILVLAGSGESVQGAKHVLTAGKRGGKPVLIKQ